MSTPENSDCDNEMKPGKIGWNELATSDPAAALAYYTKLFGWETESFPMPQGEYTMLKHNGVTFGGVMKAPQPGMPTAWTNYVSVEDVDDTVAKSNGLGGSVCMPPTDIPDVGRIAIIRDPQGGVIGLHQPPKK